MIPRTIARTVSRMESTRTPRSALPGLTRDLIGELSSYCGGRSVHRDVYLPTPGMRYPMDRNDFAKSFDPLRDAGVYAEVFDRYGMIVGENLASRGDCERVISRMYAIMEGLTQGELRRGDPRTWDRVPRDSRGIPFVSRGFVEMYHDDALAQLRQGVRLYLHHALIWNTPFLWTSFDRLGMKRPNPESEALPLHVDQNPFVHPGFTTIQGVLALRDCPERLGTFRVVPGSKYSFDAYLPWQTPKEDYTPLDVASGSAKDFLDHVQTIPLRAGSAVTWDSRTTHANTSNLVRVVDGEREEHVRYVAYVSASPAKEDRKDLVQRRLWYFHEGIGLNDRNAYTHATLRPRYSGPPLRDPEILTWLGELLYGLSSYSKIFNPG